MYKDEVIELVKGVVLCGGFGTRLLPLTETQNKHMLPVGRKQMCLYPIQTLIDAGITQILIVTGGEQIGDFLRFLSSGKKFGADLTFRVQDGAGGIPSALYLAKDFIGKDKKFVCILGDNVMTDSIKPFLDKFLNSKSSAQILLKKVSNPQNFGLAEVQGDKVIKCVEKPQKPKTDLAITGIYFFDNKVFDIIPQLKPSARRETEIVDVLNWYMQRGELSFDIIKGFWRDVGSFEALEETNAFLIEQQKKKETSGKN